MTRAVLLSLSTCLLAGCGGADTNTGDDTASAYSAALSVDAATEEAGLIAALAGKLTSTASAAADAATLTGSFMPAGCATETTAGSVVTFMFNKCTGPYGLLKLDGTVTATFTAATNTSVKIALAANALKISTVSVDVMASAVVNVGVTQDSASVTSSSSATNARGDTATHSGSYTAGWDASCLTLNGTFSTSIDAVSWSTSVSNFRICTGMCPDAGGSVTIMTMDKSVTVHYTNGGSAEVTSSPADTRGMILLACGAA